MAWIGNNWIWIVLVFGMGAMHLFGHRGHRHRSQHSGEQDRPTSRKDASPTGLSHDSNLPMQISKTDDGHSAVPAAPPAKGHEHGC